MKRFYGKGLPGVDPEGLSGKLIVIEGGDDFSRATQLEMVKDCLEHNGHATVNVGLKRSTLVGRELAEVQQGNTLGSTTLSLFYATDFADQLENRIVPALRSGIIVLADRYIYTLMARDIVRGADRDWVKSLYSIALVPDAVFYLQVNVRQLVENNLQQNSTLDYWDSGMDIGLSRELFDSFIKYQKLIQNEFHRMRSEYGFEIINGNRPPRPVAMELCARVADLVEPLPTASIVASNAS